MLFTILIALALVEFQKKVAELPKKHGTKYYNSEVQKLEDHLQLVSLIMHNIRSFLFLYF